MNRRILSVLMALAVVACAPSLQDRAGETEAPIGETAEAWLASDESSVSLIRWTVTATDDISGVLQLANLVGYQVEGESWPFEGVLGNDDLTLTVDGLFGTVTRITGEYAVSNLTLYWPSDTAELQPMSFRPGTISEYNGLVDNLRASGAEQEMWAGQAKSEDQAFADADSRLAGARQALEVAIADFHYDVDWADSYVDSVRTALDSLETAVDQVEETASSSPEWVASDLEWAESSYDYLKQAAVDALGSNGLGVIEDSLGVIRAAILAVEEAIEDVRLVDELYLNSEFAPYDPSEEEALIEVARTISEVDGPAATANVETQTQELLQEGTALIEHARSFAP